jgi:hypothetical protein
MPQTVGKGRTFRHDDARPLPVSGSRLALLRPMD